MYDYYRNLLNFHLKASRILTKLVMFYLLTASLRNRILMSIVTKLGRVSHILCPYSRSRCGEEASDDGISDWRSWRFQGWHGGTRGQANAETADFNLFLIHTKRSMRHESELLRLNYCAGHECIVMMSRQGWGVRCIRLSAERSRPSIACSSCAHAWNDSCELRKRCVVDSGWDLGPVAALRVGRMSG